MSSATLTGLPRELRDRIYGFVYDYDYIYPQPSLGTPKLPRFTTPDLQYEYTPEAVLALLLVNRRVSAEAATWFYSRVTFRGIPDHLTPFFRGIGQQRRDMVKSVAVTYTKSLTPHYIFETLKALRNLQVLTMRPLASVSASAEPEDLADIRQSLVNEGIAGIIHPVTLTLCQSYIIEVNDEDYRKEKALTLETGSPCWRVKRVQEVIEELHTRKCVSRRLLDASGHVLESWEDPETHLANPSR